MAWWGAEVRSREQGKDTPSRNARSVWQIPQGPDVGMKPMLCEAQSFLMRSKQWEGVY